MPATVIVATAHSPISCTMKRPLARMRPNGLAVQIVHATLGKMPALNPHQIDDLILGCGLPGSESEFNNLLFSRGPATLGRGSRKHRRMARFPRR